MKVAYLSLGRFFYRLNRAAIEEIRTFAYRRPKQWIGLTMP
ncbi:Uncharacterised protein [Vibrio cholerae]|nr:Uncharacterised protein [Vibrio cholerae]